MESEEPFSRLQIGYSHAALHIHVQQPSGQRLMRFRWYTSLASHARPFPDFRDAHAPIRLPAHGDPVQPSSRVQPGSESVAAPLVRADARNVEVLTDSQPVNALGNLGVLSRLLDSWTEKGVSQRDAVSIAA